MADHRVDTTHSRYRRLRRQMLAGDDLCRLCWHPGARTADHIIPEPDWPRDEEGRLLPGFNEAGNLQPAHGTMGARGPHNPCPTCGALCNQVKGAGRRYAPRRPQTRDW